MTRYYYEKWSTITTYNLVSGSSDSLTTSSRSGYYGYSINHSTKKFEGSGSITTLYTDSLSSWLIFNITGAGSTLIRYDYYSNNPGVVARQYYTLDAGTPSKAYLLEIVKAEEGTYPDNGVSGGYWYVKTTRAFPDFKMKAGGVLKSSDNGWVKVDNQLRAIDRIWVKANGQLKEL